MNVKTDEDKDEKERRLGNLDEHTSPFFYKFFKTRDSFSIF